MILPEQLRQIPKKATDFWEELNILFIKRLTTLLSRLFSRLMSDDKASYMTEKLTDSKDLYQYVRKTVIQQKPKSQKAIRDCFRDGIVKTIENDSKVIGHITITDEMEKSISKVYKKTTKEIYNLTQTLADSAQDTFIRACDKAYTSVMNGDASYTDAIADAITEAAKDGLWITYPSGHRDRVEVAVRRAVMTGVSRGNLEMTIAECDANGIPCVVVSSHLGARTSETDPIADHAGWQGQVYRIHDDGPKEYRLLEEATGYPTDPLGLCGYNCRHHALPFIPGVSENTMRQFDKKENAETYEATQEMRRMERTMRDTRRTIEGFKSAVKASTDEQLTTTLKERLKSANTRFKRQQEAYSSFAREHKLAEQRDRLFIP